jgi:Gas vesicle protein
MATEVTRSATHSIHSSTLADVLERVLDKGLVIAGDIKIKLVDIELLTIQIRLVVASVEKAREMGMDWWTSNSEFQSKPLAREQQSELISLRERIAQLEARLTPDDALSNSAVALPVSRPMEVPNP